MWFVTEIDRVIRELWNIRFNYFSFNRDIVIFFIFTPLPRLKSYVRHCIDYIIYKLKQ